MIQREWKLQEAVTRYLNHALPVGCWWSGIDHARKMSKAAGAQRKARGIKAGLPDVEIAHLGITLWIELKAGTILSEAQARTRDLLRANGHKWALARSLDDVQAACADAGIPLRAYVLPLANPDKPKRVARARKAAPRYQVGKRVTARLRASGVPL